MTRVSALAAGEQEPAAPLMFREKPYRQKKHFLYGTHRSRSPEETLTAIGSVFPRIGLTRLADITGLDRIGIPTVQAVRPNSCYLSVDGGKGLTLAAATVSAAMECIERYHVERLDLPEVELPWRVVAERYVTILADDLPLARHSVFGGDLVLPWVFGWDILNDREVAVPSELLQLTGPALPRQELGCFQFSSNGLASGNNLVEAIASGLFEVIERDALACHVHAERSTSWVIPKVAPGEMPYPLAAALIDRFLAADIRPLIYDCSVDTGCAVYMAYIYDLRQRHQGVFKGYGAHCDPEIALLRALTEAAQARLIYISGARDDFFSDNLRCLQMADDDAFIRHLEDMPGTAELPTNRPAVRPHFEEDVHDCMESLRRVGIRQVIVFDLTQPGFDLSVVKVIVPQLEGYPFRRIYQPGRRALRFAANRNGRRVRGAMED